MANPVKEVSLYIPVISKNITEVYVKQQFLEKKIGCVKNVDFVFNMKKNRREAFVHFKTWFDNKNAKDLLFDIKDENTKTQFIYYNNKFWPLLLNKSSRESKNVDYLVEKKEVEKSLKVMNHDEKDVLKEKLKESKKMETKKPEKDVQVETDLKIEQSVKKVKSDNKM